MRDIPTTLRRFLLPSWTESLGTCRWTILDMAGICTNIHDLIMIYEFWWLGKKCSSGWNIRFHDHFKAQRRKTLWECTVIIIQVQKHLYNHIYTTHICGTIHKFEVSGYLAEWSLFIRLQVSIFGCKMSSHVHNYGDLMRPKSDENGHETSWDIMRLRLDYLEGDTYRN